jgi:hypothetical protein
VQTPQLYDNQEQAKYSGQAGVQEILQILSDTYFAQGDEVIGCGVEL